MPSQDHTRTHLDNLSRALLRLHKALLDGERVAYERVHGRIPTNGAFFQLVLEMRGLRGCVRCLKRWPAWMSLLKKRRDRLARRSRRLLRWCGRC